MSNYKTEYSDKKNINTLNRGSYGDFGDGTPGKQVILNGSGNKFGPNKDTDAITVQFPDKVTEIYEFRVGGVAGTIQKTVTLTYTDNTKTEILSAVVVDI